MSVDEFLKQKVTNCGIWLASLDALKGSNLIQMFGRIESPTGVAEFRALVHSVLAPQRNKLREFVLSDLFPRFNIDPTLVNEADLLKFERYLSCFIRLVCDC